MVASGVEGERCGRPQAERTERTASCLGLAVQNTLKIPLGPE